MEGRHPVQMAMVGLGRMAANTVRRLTRAGHKCVQFASQATSAMRAEFGGHAEKAPP